MESVQPSSRFKGNTSTKGMVPGRPRQGGADRGRPAQGSPGAYGYRPKRSALEPVAARRERCCRERLGGRPRSRTLRHCGPRPDWSPQVKKLLDQWLNQRPEGLRSKLIFVAQARPIPVSRVDAAVAKAGETGGHRPCFTASPQACPGDAGDRPGHVAGSDRRPAQTSLISHDARLRQDRRPHCRRRIHRRLGEGRGALPGV